jgi:hypothetical protein
MECLNDVKIQDYLEQSLSPLEQSMVRDHLIGCPDCTRKLEVYKKIENILEKPETVSPPEEVQHFVMARLFPALPKLSSILTLMVVSFVSLITAVYIYFDFANNSIVEALRVTSTDTSNWVVTIVKTISSVFSGVYAVFKALNGVVETIFKVNIGVEVLASFFTFLGILFLYSMYKFLFKRVRETQR